LNGAGKTSLFRAALGLLPHDGHSSLAELKPRQRARKVAWMPQEREIAWPMRVDALVALGRHAHGSSLRRLTPEDEEAVERAMRQTDLVPLRNRLATELSGGERARLLLARLIAQEAPLLMADEPIAGLDPAAQITTMRLLQALTVSGKGLLVSLHDLTLAHRYCTRVVLLHDGRVFADGTPEAVLTDRNLAHAYGIRAARVAVEGGMTLQAVETLKPDLEMMR
jgi:iron complex transport system ATP-binding protein